MRVGNIKVRPDIVPPVTVTGLYGLFTIPGQAWAEAIPLVPVTGVLVGAVHRGGHTQLVWGLGQWEEGRLQHMSDQFNGL